MTCNKGAMATQWGEDSLSNSEKTMENLYKK